MLFHVHFFPTGLYLFPANCLSVPSFTASPSLCLRGAIGKYTTSRLIISRPVEGSHFSCVWSSSMQRLRKTPPTLLELGLLFGRHTPVKLSSVTALRRITRLASPLEVAARSCGGGVGACVRGELKGPGVSRGGLRHLHHAASIRIPFKWQSE